MRVTDRHLLTHTAIALTVMLIIGGCASHRAPPLCKGPYTPINQPMTAASHDPQR